MARDETSSNPFSDKDALLANVALLYYGEGLTQSEIAKRLSVSRPTIVNMLRECRDRGIVEIRVDGEVLAASALSRQLVARFGLEDAYVSRCRIGGDAVPDRAESLGQLAGWRPWRCWMWSDRGIRWESHGAKPSNPSPMPCRASPSKG